MKSATLSEMKNTLLNARSFAFVMTLGLLLTAFSAAGMAQDAGSQISLADTLTGLRSKKVSLEERNKLLAEAVRRRGVTFTLSPEIEKELSTTGADKVLIDAIKEKSPAPKVAAVSASPKQQAAANPLPVSTPAPPDYLYYQKRAATYSVTGEFDLAIADLTKSIELNGKDATSYLSRGLAYHNKKSFDQAVADFDIAIQMSPKEGAAYFARGNSYDKMGKADKAMADFQSAVDLDPANELAKANLKRLKDDQAAKEAAAAAAAKAAEPKPAPANATAQQPAANQPEPEFVDLGQVSSASAVRMVQPLYSQIAQKANADGRVKVQISLDVDGNVTDAKAVDGNPFLRQAAETAARRSKFKPATFNNHPIKATAFIVYNFEKPQE
jgi:TonB family protein